MAEGPPRSLTLKPVHRRVDGLCLLVSRRKCSGLSFARVTVVHREFLSSVRRCLLLLMLSYSCINTASAQWVKTNGPHGCNIISLSTMGDTVFASGEIGIYRSTDKGASWILVDSVHGGTLVATESDLFIARGEHSGPRTVGRPGLR